MDDACRSRGGPEEPAVSRRRRRRRGRRDGSRELDLFVRRVRAEVAERDRFHGFLAAGDRRRIAALEEEVSSLLARQAALEAGAAERERELGDIIAELQDEVARGRGWID